MTPDPKGNRLLGLLPDDTLGRWMPKLALVDMPCGKVIYESGETPRHVYFPLDAIVSLLYMTENGNAIEFVVVGNEGLVGIALFMGGGSSLHRAVVRSAGQGLRLKAQTFIAEFEQCPEVTTLLLRYTQALITHTAQTALCNRHHTIDQQLCRWLLMSLDRLPGDDLQITQESIAHMLGVRREGITEVAFNMQKAGLISYYRGHIKVLDREGLAQRTCECYSVVKREYDRLIPPTQSEAQQAGLLRPDLPHQPVLS